MATIRSVDLSSDRFYVGLTQSLLVVVVVVVVVVIIIIIISSSSSTSSSSSNHHNNIKLPRRLNCQVTSDRFYVGCIKNMFTQT